MFVCRAKCAIRKNGELPDVTKLLIQNIEVSYSSAVEKGRWTAQKSFCQHTDFSTAIKSVPVLNQNMYLKCQGKC